MSIQEKIQILEVSIVELKKKQTYDAGGEVENWDLLEWIDQLSEDLEKVKNGQNIQVGTIEENVGMYE